jgi:hypothetical protein
MPSGFECFITLIIAGQIAGSGLTRFSLDYLPVYQEIGLVIKSAPLDKLLR